MDKQPAVHLLASSRNGTLYAGVTSNLVGRIWQHRQHVIDGFSNQHNVTRLVWFEAHESMESAILREKQLKKWNRAWKIRLIEEANPYWNDLHDQVVGSRVTGFPPSRE